MSSSRQIRAVRAERHRASSSSMVVHAVRRADSDPDPRVAFVAGRSVGSAVARNRAKRRLRAAARQAQLPVATDLVIAARQGALTMPFAALHADLERLTARAAQQALAAGAEPGSAEADRR